MRSLGCRTASGRDETIVRWEYQMFILFWGDEAHANVPRPPLKEGARISGDICSRSAHVPAQSVSVTERTA